MSVPMKRILITGANSYIGTSVKEYLQEYPDEYEVSEKDTLGWTPSPSDFSGYDVVFNVAGIAHIKETKKNRHLYYDINRDLAVNIAKNAKQAGVRQFILLSTMSVYGMTVGHITKETPVNPKNAYGKSKAEADEMIRKLEDDNFRFACLRPPMVYGKDCKGNYQSLRKVALKLPFFPKVDNQRSMIYIGNLCEFVKNTIDCDRQGLFFPQNDKYVNTSELVKKIASSHDKNIHQTKLFNWIIRIVRLNIVKKVFGNLTYEPVDLVSKYSFEESVIRSETEDK